MKKLIWNYLDTKHQNVYRKKTKFGLCSTDIMDARFSFVATTTEISVMFNCDQIYASKVLRDWCDNRPIVERIPNSTNPDVWVFS
jgi:hypothetical protein